MFRYRFWIFVFVIIAVACVASIVSLSRYRRHHAELLLLQVANQADSVFRSDTLQRRLVRYFDRYAYTPDGILHPGRTANDRLLAHYLLGRAYADMGDAPMAIQAYREAVDCADTTRTDCDYAVLRNVYGQMADLFDRHNLPEEEINSLHYYKHYSHLINDTIEVASSFVYMINPYYLLNDTDMVFSLAEMAYDSLKDIGCEQRAVYAFLTPIHYFLVRKDTFNARLLMDRFEALSGAFDSEHNIAEGQEQYMYSVGMYMSLIGRTDSAERCFRIVLNKASVEAGAKGLMDIYQKRQNTDSVVKYSILFANANDSLHRNMNSQLVQRINKMYDYTKQRSLSEKRRKQAMTNGVLALVSTSIGVIIILLLTVIYRRRQQRKEIELEQIRVSFNNTYDSLQRLQDEYKQLNDNHIEYLGRLRNEITAKKQEVKKLQAKCELMSAHRGYSHLYECQIVQIFRSKAKKYTLPSNTDWTKLDYEFSHTFCSFTSDIKSKLTPLEIKVCMLVVLDFNNAEISCLLNEMSSQAVSNTKARINSRLFDENGGDTAVFNIKSKLLRDV